MIDVLAVGVAHKKGPKLEEHFQLMQAGLSSFQAMPILTLARLLFSSVSASFQPSVKSLVE